MPNVPRVGELIKDSRPDSEHFKVTQVLYEIDTDNPNRRCNGVIVDVDSIG